MTSATGSVFVLGSLLMISAPRMPASKTKAVSVSTVSVPPRPFQWPLKHEYSVPVNRLFSLLISIYPASLSDRLPICLGSRGLSILGGQAAPRRMARLALLAAPQGPA